VLLGCSLGGIGHLMPVVGAARALGDLGHEPVVLVPPSLAEAATDAEVVVLVGAAPPPGVVNDVWSRVRAGPPEAVIGLIDRELFADRCTEAMLGPAQDAVVAWQPELVVREPCEYATAVVAHQNRIPQLQLGISQSAIEYRVLGGVAATIDRHSTGVAQTITATPYLTSFPASLDPSPWPDTRRYRVRQAASRPLPAWWAADRRPLIYVTFGTVAGHKPHVGAIFRAALDAVAELPVRVLMTVGRAFDPGGLRPLPVNTHVERWVSQTDVFAEAKLVVCHGGSGTTFGALAAGLPLVICPLFADQAANARLVQDADVGLTVTPTERAAGGVQSMGPADVRALRDAISTMLHEPSYHQAASRLANEIRRTPTLEGVLSCLLP
jgi:UDP:flavonoid glycosyltransferase YjiC (YdhE family)